MFQPRACFTDKSVDNIVSWLWDFGDGRTSTEQNPCHDYGEGGTFAVNLTVTDNNSCVDSKTDEISVSEPGIGVGDGLCIADFSIESISSDCPQTICFKDNTFGTTPPTRWNWDFGDGRTSTEQNPCHTYSTGGIFIVNLEVSGCECSHGGLIVKEIVIDCTSTFSLTVFPASERKSILFKEAIVTVMDQDGKPANAVTVNTSVTGKGRKLPIVQPTSVITDINGEAQFKFRFPLISQDGEIFFGVDELTASIKQK